VLAVANDSDSDDAPGADVDDDASKCANADCDDCNHGNGAALADIAPCKCDDVAGEPGNAETCNSANFANCIAPAPEPDA